MFGNKNKVLTVKEFEVALTLKERKRFSGKQNIDISELTSEIENFFANRKFGWLGESKPMVQSRTEENMHHVQVFTSKGAVRTWGNSKETACNAIITVSSNSLDITIGYSGNKGVISAQGIGGALLTGGASLIGNAASAAKDKKMVLDTMKFIEDLLNNYFTNSEASQAQSSGIDILGQIEKLKQLHDNGILTDDEYNDKKKVLLDKL
mgnify:CR=1 FL=1|jgi:hypothetical protein|tara:strand:+ start:92 stop:715 length:624 start_codon:yes stop_codon:yes gene_type:complete